MITPFIKTCISQCIKQYLMQCLDWYVNIIILFVPDTSVIVITLRVYTCFTTIFRGEWDIILALENNCDLSLNDIFMYFYEIYYLMNTIEEEHEIFISMITIL
ncbi:hypothetical protein ACF0H5_024236 [Mactra antiquata]